MRSVADSGGSGSGGFRRVVAAFLSQPGLPFASVLSAERIERTFARHGNLFGGTGIYSTVITLWAFLGQALRDGKQASCRAAVAEIVTHQQALGQPAPTSDTGDYCRARAKLSEAALRELTVEAAADLEAQSPTAWLWKGRHAKLVDGSTFTMPDTPENQAAFPQPDSQAAGCGFPIARVCMILSLATAAVTDVAIGPYAGKETGETALLRELFDSLDEGDVVVADRYYCSFLMIALLLGRGMDVCARMHQRRHVDFRRGRRLGRGDHLVHWTKPDRPEWMDEATYDRIPQTMMLREVRFHVVEPGRRTKVLTIATTLLDADVYSKEDVAELYGFRWNSELDIRSIKRTLGLDHVRCKSPEMVRNELWTILLAHNMIRATAAAAALLHDKRPRQISFAGTCQYVLSSWMLLSSGLIAPSRILEHCLMLLQRISECEVADRPNRIEPRVIKRRRDRYPLMTRPRWKLRSRLSGDN